MNAEGTTRHYFVDEAGDLNLFDKKGRVLLGTSGVSRFFMVGVAHIPDPELARVRLEELRTELLLDPYFKDVPSFQPEQNKTALMFHAKDDLPEVRREVFKVLPQIGARVQVAIRRKDVLVREARVLFRYGKKLRAQDVYDGLVMRLFRNLLHKAGENRIVFARRGKAARKDALEQAILKAKHNFATRWGKFYDKPTAIESGYPSEHAGLQVVDYYLWALQRMYEVWETRFFASTAQDFRLVMDIDDSRHKPYGEWYSDSNPLTLEKIQPSSRLDSSGSTT
jgi:Protein of unknown function (DUF3800)